MTRMKVISLLKIESKSIQFIQIYFLMKLRVNNLVNKRILE